MAVWSIYKSGSSTIYIYSQEVRILQNEIRVENVLFQEVRKFFMSKNVVKLGSILQFCQPDEFDNLDSWLKTRHDIKYQIWAWIIQTQNRSLDKYWYQYFFFFFFHSRLLPGTRSPAVGPMQVPAAQHLTWCPAVLQLNTNQTSEWSVNYKTIT